MLINKYSPFFGQFFGSGDGGGGGQFWHVKSIYSDRKNFIYQSFKFHVVF
jgi:hypothetical protein